MFPQAADLTILATRADLRNDHPVVLRIRLPMAPASNAPLVTVGMICPTFMREADIGSAACMTCHNK